MASSFSSYFVARSGIQNAQYNLRITGQNMSNVNTTGYTRQRLDSYAVGSSGNNMRYANVSDLAIGGGVDAKGVSQLRDLIWMYAIAWKAERYRNPVRKSTR